MDIPAFKEKLARLRRKNGAPDQLKGLDAGIRVYSDPYDDGIKKVIPVQYINSDNNRLGDRYDAVLHIASGGEATIVKPPKPIMTTVKEATCNLYEMETNDGIKTILEVPEEIPNFNIVGDADSRFNIIMIDVSGSMSEDWDTIESKWNSIMADNLFGITKIYIFGTIVEFRRFGTKLCREDFISATTNLTGAIETIRLEIENCLQSLIRVFLITDGVHNATCRQPDEEIKKLKSPKDKTVEVFLFGLRDSFPVDYSTRIRSLLHNGNTNIPFIFWAKKISEIEDELRSMVYIIRRGAIALNLSEEGYLCPKLKTSNKAYQSELLLFDCHSEELEKKLEVYHLDEHKTRINVPCKFVKMETDLKFLLNTPFRQWNSIIIQRHKRNEKIPDGIFDLMEDIYNRMFRKMEEDLEAAPTTIKTRFAKKTLKSLPIEFSTLMNECKTIVGLLKGNFNSEQEQAKSILKTTVKTKYDTKNMKMKGHDMESYYKDMEAFMTIYDANRESIMTLEDPKMDDCCNVTYRSPILDLKEDTFSQMLVKEDKFTFLKEFTVTGIPIYAPVKDASQINPWALCIKRILVTPYNIVSQSVIESASAATGTNDAENKGIYLKRGDDASLLNAIIPVFDENAAKILKPLLRTNLFGMLNTFCILKNAHIIDMNVHFAALGCAFIKTVSDFPSMNRPAYIDRRINLIKSTAEIYLDRTGFKKYAEVLMSEPKHALMTECKEKYDKITIKCETLVKAAFFLYLLRSDPIYQQKLQLEKIIRLLVIEFIGRNLAKYHEQDSYTDFFVPELSSPEIKKVWKETQLKDSLGIFNSFIEANGNVLTKFYMLPDLLKQVKIYATDVIEKQARSYEIKPCIEKVNKFHNPSSAGNIKLPQLKSIALEVGLPASVVDQIFSEEMIFTYLYHGLKNKNSHDRMTEEVLSYDKAFKIVEKKVEEENLYQLKKLCIERIVKEAEERWTKEYLEAHKEIVEPMSTEEIVANASKLGVEVTLESFAQVYRFNPKSGLMNNACMCEDCPHYLIPNKSFNEHIAIERRKTTLGHQIHKTCMDVAARNGTVEKVFTLLLERPLVPTCDRKKKPTRPNRIALQEYYEKIDILMKIYKEINPVDIDNPMSDDDQISDNIPDTDDDDDYGDSDED